MCKKRKYTNYSPRCDCFDCKRKFSYKDHNQHCDSYKHSKPKEEFDWNEVVEFDWEEVDALNWDEEWL